MTESEKTAEADTSIASSSGSVLGRWARYGVPSLAVAGGIGALEVLRGRFQRSHLFMPSRYPTGMWDPSAFGMAYEDVWFESEDGVALHGWWIEHPKAVATVVYCHGNTGSIADRIGLYRHLRRMKVNIFAFDYRGYGRSEGVPSEKGLYADVRAACDQVTEAIGVDDDDLLLFGHSLGGAVAIEGALHRPVAALVVQSSFTDLRAMARHYYPGLPVHFFARNGFRSIDKVGRLTMPKLFIHGTEDGHVPIDEGRQLFAAAAEPKQWYPVRNAGHNDVHRHGSLRYFRTLTRFRKRHLGR